MKNKILIVGENKNFSYLEKKLNENGYGIIKTSTVSESLKYLEKEKINLILSELILPDFSGISLLCEIKRNLKTAAVPVLIVTEVSKNIAGLVASKCGAFFYFDEPIDINLVIKKIEYALRFSEIVKDEPLKKFPILSSLRGNLGESIKKIIDEIIKKKLKEAESCFNDKKFNRTIEIAAFILALSKKNEAEKLIKGAIAALSRKETPLKSVEETAEEKVNIKEKVRKCRELYIEKEYDKALAICRELLLMEKLEEAVTLINSMLSIGDGECDYVICPTCKTENVLKREYCQRCGLLLDEAKKNSLETKDEKTKKERKYKITDRERKNMFGYLALLLIIVSYFFYIHILAPIGIIIGIFAFIGGSRKPGGIAAVVGIILLIMSFLGVEPIQKYIREFIGQPTTMPYEFDVSRKSIVSGKDNIVITYSVSEEVQVSINVYDAEHNVVKNVKNIEKTPGSYEIVWDGLDNAGKKLSKGIFRIKLTVTDSKGLSRSISIPIKVR